MKKKDLKPPMFKINEEDIQNYKKLLAKIEKVNYEPELKNEERNEIWKEATLCTFSSLITDPTENSIKAVMEGEKSAISFINVSIKNRIQNIRKENYKKLSKNKLLPEYGKSTGEYLDQLDEFIKEAHILSEKELKLWELILDFTPGEEIKKIMGYDNRPLLNQNRYIIMEKIRAAVKEYDFRLVT